MIFTGDKKKRRTACNLHLITDRMSEFVRKPDIRLQQPDYRISQMIGRVDGLETSLQDKEAELDIAKVVETFILINKILKI
ncbi:hypothetical protein KIN20_028630 [Parelaphostrongylus tenuis]|uniref:Uncharacterized protein n=1 Tax=Parelaphostrongylus tenuis TaxID=148309 RepID=A0AAD5WF82_PARTN|nr:hypothetical protein KIN20_028630 [Parelaphostrongylus tenuis]